MGDEISVAKPKRTVKRLLNVLLIVSVCLVSLVFVARVLWRFSGSNQWELVQESDGAKVYSLKQPGSDLKQFKGSVRVRSSLAGIVAWLHDPEVCRDAGCYANTVERIDDQLEYDYFRFDMPRPFRTRDFMLRAHFHQIPQTREIWAEYAAAADKTPPNDCCFRVTAMNNTWRFTPLGNGEVEAEYTMNMDWGGFIPDVMSNAAKPQYMLVQLQQMQAYLDKDKYRNSKFDFVKEDTTESSVP